MLQDLSPLIGRESFAVFVVMANASLKLRDLCRSPERDAPAGCNLGSAQSAVNYSCTIVSALQKSRVL
jgi:hypothetical protein